MFAAAESHVNAQDLMETMVFSGVGVLVFCVALLLIIKLAPFSVQKEIEIDQNTSLGIIIGSIIIGLSIIIAASIMG